MQIVDNLLVVHNIDQKSTNLYDIKLAEYSVPICVENLDVDTQYYVDKYHSDQLFKEEQDKETQQQKTAEKEYFEINF